MKAINTKGNKGQGSERKKFQPVAGLTNLLFHDDVYKRIGGILLGGLIIFSIAWAFSFFFLKEGTLKDTFLVDKLFGVKGTTSFGQWGTKWLGESFKLFKWEFKSADVFNTWGNVLLVTGKNFLHHFIVFLIFIFLLNRFRVGRLPLGLVYFLIYTVLIGVVVGTNSYDYPAQGYTTLGALVTFLRFGIWVWFAYGLLVVSTLGLTWLKTGSLLDSAWERENRFWPLPRLTVDEKEVLIFGFLFMLAASFAEARLIVHYSYHLF